MKKKVLVIVLVMVFIGMGVVQVVDVIVQVVVIWLVIVKKDIISKLVVMLFGSLVFQYVEGIKGFNLQKGLFDVVIEGDLMVIVFKLILRFIINILIQLDILGFILNVGVDYNGVVVEKIGDIVMIDIVNGVLGGNFSLLVNGYNVSNCIIVQDGFIFFIISGIINGIIVVIDYSILLEGIWSGDVSVQFDVIWIS